MMITQSAGLVAAVLMASPVSAQLDLKPCTVATTTAQCGTFTVPEDRAQPDGRKIALVVVILPAGASGASRDKDPLFILDGGPGSAATRMASFVVGALAPVRAERDVVLMDQRGAGGPNALTCQLAPGHFVVPRDPARCVARLSSRADLTRYGTLDFVEDIDALRKALGAGHIHLYGASYGTRVAQLFLREHPAAVRSIVMAGPAPMSMIVPDSLAQGSDRAMEEIIKDCQAHSACAAAFPALKELKMPPPGFDDFSRIGLHLLMYSPETSRRIPWLLAQAAAGHTQAVQNEIADARSMLGSSIALGLHLAVLCNEDVPLAKASAGAFVAEYQQACRDWPRTQTQAYLHDPVRSKVPVLMLTGERDPVTGPARAEELRRYFPNAKIIVVPGGGHMFNGFSGCLDQAIAAFLRGDVPDAACLAKLPANDYFLGQ